LNVYEYHIKGIEYIKFIITNIIVNIFYESNDILKSKVTSDEKYDSVKIKENFKIKYLNKLKNVKLLKNQNWELYPNFQSNSTSSASRSVPVRRKSSFKSGSLIWSFLALDRSASTSLGFRVFYLGFNFSSYKFLIVPASALMSKLSSNLYLSPLNKWMIILGSIFIHAFTQISIITLSVIFFI
jgi:hypothetical protein